MMNDDESYNQEEEGEEPLDSEQGQELSAKEKKDNAIDRASMRGHSYANAASAICNVFHREGIDGQTLADMLENQQQMVFDGNTEGMQAMLINQGQTLQALFYFFAEGATSLYSVEASKIYAELAIKLNSSCRKTLLSINRIKNPRPATFIKQQNNALAQQINNGTLPPQERKEIQKPITELLSEAEHAALVKRGAQTAITANSPLAAVEAVHRSDNAGREREG